MIKGVISKATQGTTQQRSPYVTVIITDLDFSKIQVSIWNSKIDDYKPGYYVEINSPKIDAQGRASASSSSGISVLKTPPEGYERFIPHVPTVSEWEDLRALLVSFMEEYHVKQEWITFFVQNMTKLYSQYVQRPAAHSMHHSWQGGLLTHTYEVLRFFSGIYPTLSWKVNPFIVSIALLYHDMGKLFEYNADGTYTKMMDLKYHTVSSAEMLGALMRKSELFDFATINHVQHCILAHHGKKEFGSPVQPATLEAFLVHMMDNLSGNGELIWENATPDGTKAAGQTYYIL